MNLHDANELGTNIVEGQTCLDKYLHEDVEQLQQLKQHHVRLLNVDTQKRELLAACRRKDVPELCKADFPRKTNGPLLKLSYYALIS